MTQRELYNLAKSKISGLVIAYANENIKVTNPIYDVFNKQQTPITDLEILKEYGYIVIDGQVYIPKDAQLNLFWGPSLEPYKLDCNCHMLNTIIETDEDIFRLWEGEPSLREE